MIEPIQIETFKVIGIQVRTTNKDGQSKIDLEKIWNRFFSENIYETIPDKLDGDMYSIYTDYESDYTGAYTTFVGCRVGTLEDIPDGLIGLEIEGGQYIRYVAKGKLPNAVMNTWKEIWQSDSDLNREYTVDFEVYGPKSQNPENAEVEIYIAVK